MPTVIIRLGITNVPAMKFMMTSCHQSRKHSAIQMAIHTKPVLMIVRHMLLALLIQLKCTICCIPIHTNANQDSLEMASNVTILTNVYMATILVKLTETVLTVSLLTHVSVQKDILCSYVLLIHLVKILLETISAFVIRDSVVICARISTNVLITLVIVTVMNLYQQYWIVYMQL